MPNGLFKKPITFKKVIIYILIACGAFAAVFIARTAYVVMNPAAAFPELRTTSTPKPEIIRPGPTPEPAQSIAGPDATSAPGNTPIIIPDPTPDPEAVLLSQADLEFLKDRVTILLVGADQSPERLSTREQYRSDVLMLVTIDFAEKKVDMLSIPRDTMARIYNTTGRWKVNACFEHGGGIEKESFLYAKETISMLLGGVPVQYHMGVTMDGIKRVVDAMGGVDYDVDVEIKLNGRILEKGPQHLNGQQVLDYCRARKGISTDLGRIDRQQRMLFTIFDQLKSRDQLVNFPNIYSSVQNDVYTNLNLEQIAALTVFATGIDLGNIERHTLKGEYMSAYNASFFVLDQEYKCEKVKEIFGVNIKPDTEFDIEKVQKDKSSQASLDRARAFLDENADALTTEHQAQITAQIILLEEALLLGDLEAMDTAAAGLDSTLTAPIPQYQYPYYPNEPFVPGPGYNMPVYPQPVQPVDPVYPVVPDPAMPGGYIEPTPYPDYVQPVF